MAVVVLEQARPKAIRRTVAYAAAVDDGTVTIEGVQGVLCQEIPENNTDSVPVLVDEQGSALETWKPDVLVDARMRKRPPEHFGIESAPLVVGLGPGFTAGVDCHAVIETLRGHDLGRVIWDGRAAEDTQAPGAVDGFTTERLLRAPAEGTFTSTRAIGETVAAGETVGEVGREPVRAAIGGILRGLMRPGTSVSAGEKIGDIDPRGKREYCFTVSDKANAVAGRVLEAIHIYLKRRVQ